MIIAITGSNGFIGKHLVSYFSKKHTILGFQRQKTETLGNITYKKWDISLPLDEDFQCDIFIHAAANIDYTLTKEALYYDNVVTNKNVIDWVNRSNCRHFIYVSSSSVYQGIDGNIHEEQAIDESNLTNSYSLSKYQAELYIQQTLRKDIKLTILRPRAVYGEGDKVLIPNILKHQIIDMLLLPGDGKNLTSVTSVEYFIQATEAVINNQEGMFEIYNVAEKKPKSMEEIYSEVQKTYGLEGIIHVPIFLFKFLGYFYQNKMNYLIDTFGKNKVLNTEKLERILFCVQ